VFSQLLADEVKLTASGLGFSSRGGRLRGVVSTVADGCTDLHDFYRELEAADDTTPIAKYALCVAVRCLARPANNAIFAFVLAEGNLQSSFCLNTLMSCLSMVQSHGLNVMHIIMDGSSINIRVFKDLLGECDIWRCSMLLIGCPLSLSFLFDLFSQGMPPGQIGLSCNAEPGGDPHRFKTKFRNPDNPDRWIYLTVCADHCLKRSVAARCNSCINLCCIHNSPTMLLYNFGPWVSLTGSQGQSMTLTRSGIVCFADL